MIPELYLRRGLTYTFKVELKLEGVRQIKGTCVNYFQLWVFYKSAFLLQEHI